MRMSVTMFKVVVQSSLILGLDTWSVTSHLFWELGVFHNRDIHQMTGKNPRMHTYSIWVYPPIGYALEVVGIGNDE